MSAELTRVVAGRRSPLVQYGAFIVVVAALPWMPVNDFVIHLVQSVCYTAIAVTGLNVLLGLSGQMSLGQAGFYALGAYGSALTALRLNVPVPVAILIGTAVAADGGAFTGVFALRVRGLYLAMATMVAGFIVEILAQRWVGVTGGAMGLPGVPGFDVGGNGVTAFLFLAAGLFLLVQIGADYVNDSFVGRRLRAIRESETFAASVGIAVPWWRAVTFAVCAALAGLSGALFAHQSGYVGSDAFTIRLSISLLIAAVIGGLGARTGPLLGTVLLLGLVEFLSGIEKYGPMIYGGILLVVLLVFPRGVAGLFALFGKRGVAPSAVGESAVAAPTLTLAGMRKGAALSIAGVSKSYAGVKAVDNASIEVVAGTVHGLIGPNGAGKSTIINLVAGLYRCDAGTVAIGSHDVTSLDTTERARLGLARTFQNLQLIEALTAMENVLLGVAAPRHWLGDFHAWWTHRDFETQSRAEALAVMRFLGIEAIAAAYPGELSYGHRKLVELTRAILQRPAIMLLDEPIAGLNTVEAREISQAILQLRNTGVTIVVVEHNMEFVMSTCDTVSVLDHGQLVVTGTPELVQRDPRVIAAYLGVPLDELDATGQPA
ncbi:branched-chain amino acid ABC transporter ATP-binding protein/permease [soil metagenome]